MQHRVIGQVFAFGLLSLAQVSVAQTQIRVACIGNSITEGYGLQNASTQSYPSQLKVILGNGYTVQNDGASGRTMRKNDSKNSYWTYGHLGQALAFKPDIVIIELGTNDANNFASTWNSISAEYKRDYLAMIDTLRSQSVKPKVYPMMPLPIRGGNDSILVKANAIIKEVAAERGLTAIDCYTPFKGQNQLYTDGLHPNAAGADTMAHIVYRAITATVSLAENHSSPAGRALFADIGGGSFARLTKALNGGGEYKIRVFDTRGTVLLSAEVGGASPQLEAVRSRLTSAQGLAWIAVEPK